MVLAGAEPWTGRGRRRRLLRLVQALDRQGVGLNRGLQGLEGGGQRLQRGLQGVAVVTHGGRVAWCGRCLRRALRRWRRGWAARRGRPRSDIRCHVDGYFGVTRPYALPRA